MMIQAQATRIKSDHFIEKRRTQESVISILNQSLKNLYNFIKNDTQILHKANWENKSVQIMDKNNVNNINNPRIKENWNNFRNKEEGSQISEDKNSLNCSKEKKMISKKRLSKCRRHQIK